jgi:hypothetical protein
MVGIVGMHALRVRAWGIWTVVAIRPSGIKLGHNLGKELEGIPSAPAAAVKPLLPMPVLMAPEILVTAVEEHK